MANQHYISKASAATGSITGLTRDKTGNNLTAKNTNPVKAAPASSTNKVTRNTDSIQNVARPRARNI